MLSIVSGNRRRNRFDGPLTIWAKLHGAAKACSGRTTGPREGERNRREGNGFRPMSDCQRYGYKGVVTILD
jgi:hypothetical protein